MSNASFWWITARASGVVGYLLITASMVAGVFLHSRLMQRVASPIARMEWHKMLAILGLAVLHHQQTSSYSFDLLKLYQLSIPSTLQFWFFLAFALAFCIKVPLFPFHTWLPDAHVQAPTAGSIILAGVLLKMGTYGLMRFAFPLFPQAAVYFAPWIALLAVIGIAARNAIVTFARP
mgnify:CR=1 FL=1